MILNKLTTIPQELRTSTVKNQWSQYCDDALRRCNLFHMLTANIAQYSFELSIRGTADDWWLMAESVLCDICRSISTVVILLPRQCDAVHTILDVLWHDIMYFFEYSISLDSQQFRCGDMISRAFLSFLLLSFAQYVYDNMINIKY